MLLLLEGFEACFRWNSALPWPLRPISNSLRHPTGPPCIMNLTLLLLAISWNPGSDLPPLSLLFPRALLRSLSSSFWQWLIVTRLEVLRSLSSVTCRSCVHSNECLHLWPIRSLPTLLSIVQMSSFACVAKCHSNWQLPGYCCRAFKELFSHVTGQRYYVLELFSQY